MNKNQPENVESPFGAASCYTDLEENELPKVGDEASLDNGKRWEKVNIPSMWLAGGQRMDGVLFRRPYNDKLTDG